MMYVASSKAIYKISSHPVIFKSIILLYNNKWWSTRDWRAKTWSSHPLNNTVSESTTNNPFMLHDIICKYYLHIKIIEGITHGETTDKWITNPQKNNRNHKIKSINLTVQTPAPASVGRNCSTCLLEPQKTANESCLSRLCGTCADAPQPTLASASK